MNAGGGSSAVLSRPTSLPKTKYGGGDGTDGGGRGKGYGGNGSRCGGAGFGDGSGNKDDRVVTQDIKFTVIDYFVNWALN